MKITTLALSLLLSSGLLMAETNTTQLEEFNEEETEEERNFGFSANIGTWFVGWDQTSTASNMLSNSADALNVNYNINNSMATAVNFHINYGLVSGNMEYYNDINSKKDEKTTGASLGLSALDFINNLSTEVRIVKAEFDGQMSGTLPTANGEATFETELEVMDFILYPYNHYVGLGYRKYKYDFPQDVYLIRNSDSTTLPIQDKYGVEHSGGLLNINYKGHFYTLVVDNQRLVSTEDDYQGIVYSAIAGIGKLKPSASGYDEWITESDARFIDASLGYTYNKLGGNNYNLGVTAGYRYNQIKTEASKTSGTHSLITEFETKFHGPFVKLVYSY